MKLFSVLFFSFVIVTSIYSQQVTLITNLNNPIKETSGLITINQKLITHNDSGGEPALYEIDSLTGNFTRKVIISNASNNDWEDICLDSLYIYIGDFGNNSGSRTNLKIYRVLISDYINTPNDTVTADTINFNYADQTNFTPSSFSTNFDAEAIIAINDSLYVFTKNWGDFWSNIYSLPITPGTYSASKIDSINSQGLVTGATYNNTDNSIGLTGYTISSAFFIKLHQFVGNQFSGGIVTRNLINVPASFQVESISHIDQNQYYLTAEEHSSGTSSLYRLYNQPVGIGDVISSTNYIYPNPVSSILHLKFENLKSAQLFNLTGVEIYKTNANTIDVSNLKKGVYYIKLTNSINSNPVFQKLLID
jgi:hypothetical protein